MAIARNALLTSTANGSPGASTTTSSVSNTTNALLLMAVCSGDAGGAPAPPTSITGLSLTWVMVASTTLGNICQSVWRAMGAGTTGAITINWAAGTDSVIYQLDEFTGVNVAGVNGSAAVRQFGTSAANTTTPTVTLASAPLATSASYGAVNHNDTAQTASAGSGLALLGAGTTNVGSPSQHQAVEWDSTTPGTTVDFSWTGAGGAPMVALEIAAPGVYWRGTATAIDDAAPSSKAVNVPTGVQDGDLLLLYVGLGVASPTVPTITTPAGWTVVSVVGGSVSSLHRLGVYSRVASSEPASYTVTFSGGADCALAILGYAGQSTADPLPSDSHNNDTVTSGASVTLNNNPADSDGMVWQWAATINPTSTSDPVFVGGMAGSSPAAIERVDLWGASDAALDLWEETRATGNYFASARSISWTPTTRAVAARFAIRPEGTWGQYANLDKPFNRSIVTAANVPSLQVNNFTAIGVSSIGTAESVPSPQINLSINMASIVSAESFGNLLNRNQASIETDASGWNDVFGGGDYTLTRDTTQAADGAASLRFRKTSPGDIYIGTVATFNITGGAWYTARISYKAATVGRISEVIVQYFGGAGATHFGTGLMTNTSTWTDTVLNTQAPSDAVSCRIITYVGGAAGNEDHYIDKISLTKGVNVPWESPVISITGGAYLQSVTVSSIGTAESVPSATILGGSFSQSVTAASIAAPLHQFGGSLLTLPMSNVQSGVTYSGNQAVAFRSTLSARSGIGMLQLQVSRGLNMLTANQANGTESGATTGWAALNFASVASTTAQAASGTRSLQITATAAGASAITTVGASGCPVFPDTQYSATMKFRSAAAAGRTGQAILFWYDSGGSFIGQSGGGTITITTGGFTQATITANSPTGAAFAAVVPIVTDSANGEVFYVDEIGMFHGSITTWVAGGLATECHVVNSNAYTSMAVLPSTVYNIGAWGWQLGSAAGSQSQSRFFRVQALFYDSAGSFISSGSGPTPQVTLSTTAWTQSSGTTTSPSNAVFCILQLMVQSTVNMLPGELFYIDEVTFEPVNKPVGFPVGLSFTGSPTSTYWSVPRTVENTVTGDVDMMMYLLARDWSPAGESIFASQYDTTANRNWILYQPAASSSIVFGHSVNGVSLVNSSWSPGWTDGTWHWLRITHQVDNGAGQNVVRFYTRTLETDAWSLQQTVTNTGAITRFNSTAPLVLGNYYNASSPFIGDVAFFELKNGIGDDARSVARFDTRIYAATPTPFTPTTPTFLPGPNLTSSPTSFEDTEGIVGWSGNNATLKRVPVNAVNGLWALRATTTTTSAGWGTFTPSTRAAPVVPGRTYTVYFYATKGIGAHSTRAVLEWRDAAGAGLTTAAGSTVALTTTPQLYSVSAVAPASAAIALCDIYTTTTGAVGDYFDVDFVGIFEGADFWKPTGAGWKWHLVFSDKAKYFEPDGQYVYLPGVSGNHISTPDTASLDITGDIDLRIRVAGANLAQSSPIQTLIGKYSAQKSFLWQVFSNKLRFYISGDGSTTNSADSNAMPVTPGDNEWVTFRVTRRWLTGETNFYWARDWDSQWRRLGGPFTVAAGVQIWSGTAAVTIGAFNDTGTGDLFTGKVAWAELHNGINGPVVAAFDADMVSITTSQTPTTTSTLNGANWTINGTGWQWSKDDALGVEPRWMPYIGTPDVRRSTVSSPTGDGFVVATVVREAINTYGEVTVASTGASTIQPGDKYSAVESKRVPVPLPSRGFFGAKINWNNGSGYVNQMNTPTEILANGGSTSRWVVAGVEGIVPATVDRSFFQSYMGSDPLAGEVWFSGRFSLMHGDMVDWEAGSGTTSGPAAAGAASINLNITASSITSSANVPGPGSTNQAIYPIAIRGGQNSVRLDNGAYMTAPGDNLVSSIFASFEAGSGAQGITSIPQNNQCTLTYVVGGYPNLLTSNQGNVETDATGWVANYNCQLHQAGANLLTFNQASLETDLTGWDTTGWGGGATITRSTVTSLHGAACLAITSTVNGQAQARVTYLSGAVAVTAGTTYTYTAWVRAATTSRTVNLLVNWLDAGAGLTGQLTGTGVADNTGGWVQVTATGAAPATTTVGLAYIQIAGTVIGEVHYADQIGFVVGASTTWTPPGSALDGSRSLAMTALAAGTFGVLETSPGQPVIPGRTYTSTASFRSATVGRGVQCNLSWWTSVGAWIRTDGGPPNTSNTSGWTLHFSTAVAPAGAAYCRTELVVQSAGAAGEVHYADRISLQDVTVPVGVVDGVQCCKVVATTVNANWGPYEHQLTEMTLTVGAQYTLSGWVTAGQGAYSVTPRIEWKDAANVTQSTSSGTPVVLSNTPQLAFVTAACPVGCVRGAPIFYVTSAGVPGDFWYLDKVCFRSGVSTTFLDSYHPGLDLDVRIGFIPDVLATGAAQQCLISKYDPTVSKRGWYLALAAGGELTLGYAQDGITFLNSTSTVTLGSVGFASGMEFAVRATLQVNSGGVNRVANFYYSTNGGGTWSALGSTVTTAGALTNGLFRSDTPLLIGNRGGLDLPFEGEILWAELLDSINGGRVFYFDASTVDATAPQIPTSATAA